MEGTSRDCVLSHVACAHAVVGTCAIRYAAHCCRAADSSPFFMWHCSQQVALCLSLICCHRFLYQQYPKLGAFACKHVLPTTGAALHPQPLLCQLSPSVSPEQKQLCVARWPCSAAATAGHPEGLRACDCRRPGGCSWHLDVQAPQRKGLLLTSPEQGAEVDHLPGAVRS